jgi:hypothetical protein
MNWDVLGCQLRTTAISYHPFCGSHPRGEVPEVIIMKYLYRHFVDYNV